MSFKDPSNFTEFLQNNVGSAHKLEDIFNNLEEEQIVELAEEYAEAYAKNYKTKLQDKTT